MERSRIQHRAFRSINETEPRQDIPLEPIRFFGARKTAREVFAVGSGVGRWEPPLDAISRERLLLNLGAMERADPEADDVPPCAIVRPLCQTGPAEAAVVEGHLPLAQGFA